MTLSILRGEILGCGTPTAYLTDISGDRRLASIDLTGLSYSRRLDDTSECRIDLGAEQADIRCPRALADAEPWRYGLTVYRDADRAWDGPLTEAAFGYDGMTLQGRDGFAWFERRVHPVDRSFVDIDLSTIAATFMSDALSVDDSPTISFSVAPSGILGTRAVNALSFTRVSDSLRELFRTGIDFTVVGRRIYLFPEVDDDPILNLTENNFEVTGARLAGLDSANDVIVLGAQPQGVTTPLYWRAGGVDTPLIQQVYSDPSILDTDSATAAAESRWRMVNRAPLYVTGVLLESAAISFNNLVCGRRVRLRQRVGFKTIDQTMRISAVDVSYSFSDKGSTEVIALTLVPSSVVE